MPPQHECELIEVEYHPMTIPSTVETCGCGIWFFLIYATIFGAVLIFVSFVCFLITAAGMAIG